MKIIAKNIVKSYRNRRVVDTISLDVKQGEIVGLLGPNGAGKTTSFYMIVGLVKPDEGYVYLNNEDITKWIKPRGLITSPPCDLHSLHTASLECAWTSPLQMPPH